MALFIAAMVGAATGWDLVLAIREAWRPIIDRGEERSLGRGRKIVAPAIRRTETHAALLRERREVFRQVTGFVSVRGMASSRRFIENDAMKEKRAGYRTGRRLRRGGVVAGRRYCFLGHQAQLWERISSWLFFPYRFLAKNFLKFSFLSADFRSSKATAANICVPMLA